MLAANKIYPRLDSNCGSPVLHQIHFRHSHSCDFYWSHQCSWTPHPSTPDHFFHLLFKSLLKRLTAQSTTSQLFLFRDCQLISLSLSLSLSLVCPHLCYFTPAMSSHLNNLVSSFSALLLLIFRVAQFKTKQLCRNI